MGTEIFVSLLKVTSSPSFHTIMGTRGSGREKVKDEGAQHSYLLMHNRLVNYEMLEL